MPDQAIELFRRALDLDPSFVRAHAGLGIAYEQQGLYNDAIEEYEKAIALSRRSPILLSSLGQAYAASGNKDNAHRVLDELKSLSKQGYVSQFDMALIFAGLGERDLALESLMKAYQDRDFRMVELSVESRFDNLRTDPRYKELLRRVGLASR